MACTVDTKKVNKLISQIKGYSKKECITAIGIWQEKNSDSQLPEEETLYQILYSIKNAKNIAYKNKITALADDITASMTVHDQEEWYTKRQKTQEKMAKLFTQNDIRELVTDLTFMFYYKFTTRDGNGHTWKEYLEQTVLKENNETNVQHIWHMENDADPYLYMIQHFSKEMFAYLKQRMDKRWEECQPGAEYEEDDRDIRYIFDALHDNNNNDIWEMLCEQIAIELGNKLGYNITLRIGIDDLVTQDNDTAETLENLSDGENTVTEGWQVEVGKISNESSLSRKIKIFLNSIPQLMSLLKNTKTQQIDYIPVIGRLGYPKNLNGSVAYAMLLKTCHYARNKEEMFKIIEEEAKRSLVFRAIHEKLQDKETTETMKTALFVAVRKDYVEQWMMTMDDKNPTRTANLNKEHKYGNLFQVIKENAETGTVLSAYSIYDHSGDYIGSGSLWRHLQHSSLYDYLFKDSKNAGELYKEVDLSECKTEQAINDVYETLLAIGCPCTLDEVKYTISNINDKDNMEKILLALHEILKGPSRQVISEEKRKQNVNDTTGYQAQNTMQWNISVNARYYGSIAKYFNINNENLKELSVFIIGQGTYYSMRNPSYETTLFKRLRDAYLDAKNNYNSTALQDLLKELYDGYFWYTYKDAEGNTKYWGWPGEILKRQKQSLSTISGGTNFIPPLFNIRDFPAVKINGKTKKYEEMTEKEFYKWMFDEYWNFIGQDPIYAQYALPIRSNNTSLRSIGFFRYDFNPQDGINNTLVTKLAEVVQQERARIILVKKRDDARQNGEKIPIIEHWDIERDSQGNIISEGGSVFKFLPLLNNYKTKENKPLLATIDDYLKEAKPVGDLIKQAVWDVMDQMWREEYKKYCELEVFNCSFDTFSLYVQKIKKVLDNYKDNKDDTIQEYCTLLTEAQDYYKNNELAPQDLHNQIEKLVYTYNKNHKTGQLPSPIINFMINYQTFFFNTVYAQSQIIEMLNVDLAFANGPTDFQKRFKQVEGAGTALDTQAKDNNGNRVGKETEKSITLKDIDYQTQNKQMAEIILQSHKQGKLSDYTAASHLALFGYSNCKDKNGKPMVKVGNVTVYSGKINSTNGQSMRTLPSWRAIMIMADNDKWSEGTEKAYQNIINGEFEETDILTVFNSIKPFAFSLVGRESYVEGFGKIKVPIQHKNSEMLLLSIYQCASNLYQDNPVVQGLNQFLVDNDIDVVHFESCVKQGAHSIGDINGCTTKEQVMQKLNDCKENIPNFVQEFPYEDYHIQVETPEHFVDEMQGIGTQIRNLIYSDMADDATFTVAGKTMTKKEWLKEYCAIYTTNILEKYQQVVKRLVNKEELMKLLQEEILSNDRYNKDLINAVALLDDGEFAIPFFENSQSIRIEQIICSIIRKNITRQKTKGGTLIQCSSVGFSNKLRIKTKTVKDNKGYTHTSIEYFECYMPASAREWLEPLLTKDGQIDISKLDKGSESLLNAIGYRIPTEGMSSAIPLRIKGFLPVHQGDAIMFPAEVLAMSGSDFDVDKLFIMLYEFKTIRYDYSKAIADFAKTKSNTQIADALKVAFKNSSDEEIQKLLNSDEEDTQDFKEWWKENKSNYELDPSKYKFRKIEYDEGKSMVKNSRKARNNRLIDLMWGVLTSEAGSQALLNPQGFHDVQTHSKIITLLTNYSYKNLCSLLNKNSLKSSFTDNTELFEYLRNLDVEVLTKLIQEVENQIEPLVPSTITHFMRENMVALNLTAIYALYNPLHATICNFSKDFQLKDKINLFNYNAQSLAVMKDRDGNFVSKNIGQFLGASVDNGKDPNLAKLMQNQDTAQLSMFMFYLGFTISDVSVFFNQPIIREYIRKVMTENTYKKKKEALEKLKEKFTVNTDTQQVGDTDTSMEQMLKNILNYNDLSSLSNDQKNQFNIDQLQLLTTFLKLMAMADQFKRKVVMGFRFNVEKGAMGPTIAETELHLERSATTFNIDPFEKDPDCYFENIPKVIGNLSWQIQQQKIQQQQQEEKDKQQEQQPEVSKEELEKRQMASITSLEDNNTQDTTPEERPAHYKDYLDIDTMLDWCLNKGGINSMEAAYYLAGVEGPLEILSQYFSAKHSAPTRFIENYLKKLIGKRELSKQLKEKLKREFLLYYLTQLPVFADVYKTDPKTHKVYKAVSKRGKRLYMLYNFPLYFQKMMEENEECKNNPFLKRLKVLQLKNTKLNYIELRSLGKSTTDTDYTYTKAWEQLLHSSDVNVQKLAVQLYVYSLYTTAGGFGFNGFGHLAPVSVKLALPKWRDTLYKLLHNSLKYPYFSSIDTKENEKILEILKKFCRQFVQNNLYSGALNVTTVPLTSIESVELKSHIWVNESFTISAKEAGINEDSPLFGKRIVRISTKVKGNNKYDYRDLAYYIYYDKDKSEYHFHYIKPLGYPHQFLEYDYTVEGYAWNMNTVFNPAVLYNRQFEDTDEDKELQEIMNTLNSKLRVTYQIDENYLGVADSSNDNNDEPSDNAKAQLVDKDVTYEKADDDDLGDANSLSTYPTPQHYTDATNQDICGS